MDHFFLHAINAGLSSPVADFFLVTASDFDLFTLPLLIAVVLLLSLGGWRGRIFVGMMALCLLIGDSGIGWSIKRATSRPRPHEAVEWVTYRNLETKPIRLGPLKIPTTFQVKSQPARVTMNPNGRSMPSGHVLNNVALAILVTIYYRKWAIPFWIWALIMAVSRVYTGSHYPSDCLVSFGLAIFYTPAIIFGLDWLWKHLPFPFLEKWRRTIPSLAFPGPAHKKS
ncbi:phosphatase PAP2 family protein [Kamptonema cortianum]|uniref:Phosphatase PAP2 family protein n=1 Tax=Geitlerinema calcuttense NRMC-F 0142 TaxID=2922238 RepID=A0ABT7LY57_9CYAN|nr:MULTISPECIES: phosphatase PAP2 family protein [Cyanophyceae]MDK3157531.1 phosphatase PAP2 family protein [Kamptonema cortianum]MDL5052638.1 phosphatase PAP2 family protein [Oscillatoria laete-virens NRMC-F 0139]MDL5056944.1 phosphatase PAP2 family protein [Geitlerinema calcuttense NRMC-F 0142]